MKEFIQGYASRFNMKSEVITEKGKTFREVMLPGCFDEAIEKQNNIVYVLNHSSNPKDVIACTDKGNLKLTIDSIGLHYSIEVKTKAQRKVFDDLAKGKFSESSFRFTVYPDDIDWKIENGENVRYVKRVHELLDVSTVLKGAYKSATAEATECNNNICKRKLIPTENARSLRNQRIQSLI